MKHCTSHKTSTASYSPAHECTSCQILHIYGISVVICGGLPTRQVASNHHKPPLIHRKYAGFGMMSICKNIVLHQHGIATLNEPCSLDKIVAFYQHTNNHHPKFWWWFAVVCGGLPASSLVSLPIVPNSGGDLRWCAVVCGDLRWFVF